MIHDSQRYRRTTMSGLLDSLWLYCSPGIGLRSATVLWQEQRELLRHSKHTLREIVEQITDG